MSDPAAHPPDHDEFHIQIDRAHYDVDKDRMTGEELRHVPPVPIPEDRDLYEVRPAEGTGRSKTPPSWRCATACASSPLPATSTRADAEGPYRG